MSDRLWISGGGDPCFVEWLKRVDALCKRFLDGGMLEFPEIDQVPWLDTRDAYDDDVRPEHFFVRLLHELSSEHGEDFMNRHIARVCKWHPSLRQTEASKSNSE